MNQISKKITGVHCKNCVNKIISELGDEFGPISFSSDFGEISFCGDESEFADALADLGFELDN